MKAELVGALADEESSQWTEDEVKGEFERLEKSTVRGRILAGETRIDGRDTKTVRPIDVKVGVLPRAHGSALFTRGETQAMVVTTLGTGRDAQIIDALEGERKDPFMLHYNFPPYCVGETGFMSGPKRREIGHGRLARRSIEAVLPDMESFPYVIRVVSEITESNGSSFPYPAGPPRYCGVPRGRILAGETRIDGRDTKTVRPIDVKVGVLPRAHGSALFTRGETQAMVVTTLGTGRDAQIIDALEGERKDPFMLHYNFPPYCVGETGFMSGPKRREIGHGRLARRSIEAVLPDMESFPYVIRVVSEITESNGSSSMASVCGTSLSLMDAGVPTGAPVAGVAMGLIKEGDSYVVLTDILGDEDHLGDMDFTVAGSAEGITAV